MTILIQQNMINCNMQTSLNYILKYTFRTVYEWGELRLDNICSSVCICSCTKDWKMASFRGIFPPRNDRRDDKLLVAYLVLETTWDIRTGLPIWITNRLNQRGPESYLLPPSDSPDSCNYKHGANWLHDFFFQSGRDPKCINVIIHLALSEWRHPSYWSVTSHWVSSHQGRRIW